MNTCHARQEGQELACTVCALRWDIYDPEPPNCGDPQMDQEQFRSRLKSLCAACGPNRCEIRQGMAEPCEPMREE